MDSETPLPRTWQDIPPGGLAFFGDVSSAFREHILLKLNAYAPEELDFFRERGVKFAVGYTALDIMPDVSLRDDGDYYGRTHCNQYGAAFSPGRNLAWVAECVLKTEKNIHPAIELKPNLSNSHWEIVTPKKGSISITHEAAHALSHNLRGVTRKGEKRVMSDAPGFGKALQSDIDALGGVLAAEKKGYGYNLQWFGYGAEENFAEARAALHGGGTFPKYAEHFPRTVSWMKEFIAGFRQVWHQGPRAVGEFVFYYGDYESQIRRDLEDAICTIHRAYDLGRRGERQAQEGAAKWENAISQFPSARRRQECENIIIRGDYYAYGELGRAASTLLLEDMPSIEDEGKLRILKAIDKRFPDMLAQQGQDFLDAHLEPADLAPVTPSLRVPRALILRVPLQPSA
jgi:hypothetical protein